MMEKERRQYSRKTLNPLPYIDLSPDSGGIVLDVSEGGLRFRATAPVNYSGPIHFSFTSQSNLVAGIGELVWIDPAKKTGGLRFTDIPYSALEQIRKLPLNSDLRPSIGEDLAFHISAPNEPPSLSRNPRGAGAGFRSRIASVFNQFLSASFGSKAGEGRLPRMESVLSKLRTPFAEGPFPKQNRWLLRASCALFLGIVVSSVVYARHRQTGELLIKLGMKLSGRVDTITAAPTAASLPLRADDASAYSFKENAPVTAAVPPPVSTAAGKVAEDVPAGTATPRIQETALRLPKPESTRKQIVVQVAALTDEVEARKLSETLRQEDFQAFVGTFPIDSFYRVMLGPYADKPSALIVLGKLKKAGFSSFIRRESVAERLGS